MQTPFHEFQEVFLELNAFVIQENAKRQNEGLPLIAVQTIRVVGQTALLLSNMPFPVTASMDLDVISQIAHPVQKKLGELLSKRGLRLESDGHLIWMPEGTRYETIFDLLHIKVMVADAESVLASKLRFNRLKDHNLFRSYGEYFPDKMDQIKKRSIP